MKKIFLPIILLALCLGSTSARSGFGFGAKAGVNVNTYSYSTSAIGNTLFKRKMSSNAGFTGGVFADYIFRNGFALSADLLYSKQNYHVREYGSYEGELRYMEILAGNMHYLNIPILANYYIIGGLAVKTGIQTGFLLSQKSQYFARIDFGGQRYSESTDAYKTVDVSIPVGLSYLLKFGLLIDARYNIGVMNTLKAGSDRKIRSGYFSVTAGFRF